MIRSKTVCHILALSLTLLAASASLSRAAEADLNKLQSQYDSQIKPLFAKYCYECHGNGKSKGKFAMDKGATLRDLLADPKHWNKTFENLRDKNMPPEDEAQPSAAEMNDMITWVDQALQWMTSSGPQDPGRVALHRLNRSEYNNTIRDLVGVDIRPARGFPTDDSGYGFDNIAEVLSMSPLLAEKYLTAAEEVLDQAIVTRSPYEKKLVKFEPPDYLERNGKKSRNGAKMEPGSALYVMYKFPVEAEYEITWTLIGVGKGDKTLKTSLKAGEEDPKSMTLSAGKNTLKRKLKIKAGDQPIGASLGKDPWPGERRALLESIQIEGPFNAPPPPLPDSHKRIFFIQPGASVSETDAARRIIQRFAAQAFRRPAVDAEVDRYLKLFAAVRKEANFEQAVKLPLTAILCSPHFLFRIEKDSPADSSGIRTLDDYELATRLSYFLWSSMPDQMLFDLAAKGELHKDHVLQQQVQRMLADPKSAALTGNFAGQWLELRLLEDVNPDTEKFPTFDDDLRHAMRREIELLFETIVKEDRSVMEFVYSDYTFVNRKLAEHYGIQGVGGDQFQKVSTAGTPRGGVITSAAILTLTSNPTRTSPVKRGAWVLEQILGTPPPPPPPVVPEFDESKKAEASGTLRQRLVAHQVDPNCSICHRRMDPIGFSLENFNALGIWRAKDGEFEIDTAGILPDGATFTGPDGLKKTLLNRKEQIAQAMTQRLLTYALGRGVEYYDRPTILAVARKMSQGDYRFSIMINEIVNSDPFRKRRAYKSPEAPASAPKSPSKTE